MPRTFCVLILAAGTALSAGGGAGRPPDSASLPGPELNLTLAAPISTWDEAIPLGNGLMGGLLWGGESTIKLSLDRGDLWDERPADGMRWDLFTHANLVTKVAQRDEKYIDDVFDRAYRDSHPSKIPAGRVEIALDPGQRIERFELDLASAEGRARVRLDRARRAARGLGPVQPFAHDVGVERAPVLPALALHDGRHVSA